MFHDFNQIYISPLTSSKISYRANLRRGLEVIPRLPLHNLQVPHTSSSGGLPPNSLHGPVVLPDLGGRVSARRARRLLLVERPLTAAPAQRVSLGVAKTCST